jgi:hypothetical protein
MATLEDQQKLIEVLKFTPRTYKISLWGYGGEKVMGTVEREAWDYCMDNQVDLSDISWNNDAADDMELDADRLPFLPGSWYECDNLAHVNGVNKTAGTLQIEDEHGETVVEASLDSFDGCSDDSIEWECDNEVWVGQSPEGTVVFIGTSNEKGTFFEGEIELTEPFDITKLTLQYDDIDGEELVNAVTYNGEDIDNWGGSTNGKSSDFTMCLVKENGEWENYEPEEKDWGHPEYGTSPSTWEKSKTFKFNKQKPTIPGYYSCTWRHYGTTYGSAYWDGENFGEWEYGKFNTIADVVSWSGYTWDTSSWVNQPPEPVDLECEDKTCGWVGKSEERIEDANYDRHCPKCNGIEFDWIDYDPDTKQGRDNRKKYCKEWDPEESLKRIIG